MTDTQSVEPTANAWGQLAEPAAGTGQDEPNTFAGARLDRAGTRRRDPEWLRNRLADPDSRVVLATSGGVYLRGDTSAPALVALADLADLPGAADPILLGMADGRALLAVDLDATRLDGVLDGVLDGARLIGLREAASELAPADAGLVAYAAALLNWHRTHRHCSVCGTATRVEEGGLLRVCPRCGASHHPRTDPVIIVLVTDGERVLLGRQPSWPPRRYSCLAGFVEPGESLEDAVVREVLEESGVQTRAPRYVSSQPWPFPSSLMLGYRAEYAAGSPVPADEELEDVRWFTRVEVTAATEQRGELLLPPRLAIARRLIDGWLAEAE